MLRKYTPLIIGFVLALAMMYVTDAAAFWFERQQPILKEGVHSVSCSGFLGDLNECKTLANAVCKRGYKIVNFNKRVVRAKGPQYEARLDFICKSSHVEVYND
ncbi:MAG: hypothetical protein ACREAU_06095 [Nitrosopumilaceae archaeon]